MRYLGASGRRVPRVVGHGSVRATLLGRTSTMKNCGRLVRFAWPYRLRFGLSIGCALVVALLYGADIAAAYPLLTILFYNENCQKWVAQQIVNQETEGRKSDARHAAVGVRARHRTPGGRETAGHLQRIPEHAGPQRRGPARLRSMRTARSNSRARWIRRRGQ